jgi:hypothetical protein
LAELPPELKRLCGEQVYQLIDSVFSESQLMLPEDGRTAGRRRAGAQRQLPQARVQGSLEPHQPQGGLQRQL